MKWRVGAEHAGRRLDLFVAESAPCSRAEARRLIERGAVKVAARPSKKGALVKAGDEVTLTEAPLSPEDLRPVADPGLPLALVHEDDELLVVCKPAGVA